MRRLAPEITSAPLLTTRLAIRLAAHYGPIAIK
jgi:hypothetical protein